MSAKREGLNYDSIPSLEGSGRHYNARFWDDPDSGINSLNFPWSNINPDVSTKLPPITVELSKPLVQDKQLQGEITLSCPDGFQMVALNYVKGGVNRSELGQKVSKKVNTSENTKISLFKNGQLVALGELTFHLYSKQDGEVGYEIDGAKLQPIALPNKDKQTSDEIESDKNPDQHQLWKDGIDSTLSKHSNDLFLADDLSLQVNYEPNNRVLFDWYKQQFFTVEKGENISLSTKVVKENFEKVIDKLHFFLRALHNFNIHTPQQNSEEVLAKIESLKPSIPQLTFIRDILQDDHEFKLEYAPAWVKTVIDSPEITSVLIKIKEILADTRWLDIDNLNPNDPLTKLAFFASVSPNNSWSASPTKTSRRTETTDTSSASQPKNLTEIAQTIKGEQSEANPPENLIRLAQAIKGKQS